MLNFNFYIPCGWLVIMQDHQGISNVAPTDAPLRQLPIAKVTGPEPEATADPVEARIHDSLGNLRFCISPTSFFQV